LRLALAVGALAAAGGANAGEPPAAVADSLPAAWAQESQADAVTDRTRVFREQRRCGIARRARQHRALRRLVHRAGWSI